MQTSPITAGVRILVIDDDENHARAMAEILERVGYDVTVATSGESGLATIESGAFDIVITDLVMSPVSGIDILERARELHPDCEVILVSGHGSFEQAVDALKMGAANYLTKPLDLEVVRSQVNDLASRIRSRRGASGRGRAAAARAPDGSCDPDFPEFIGQSESLRSVFEIVRKVAPTPATVLITGSNGTGKELVARAIHRLSPRRNRPFVALNCGAMAENILESELFGHVRGAFTGAMTSREGRFEYADKGTLFLDEIGDMSLNLQVKLLRVIQEREIVRVGANEPTRVDVRIIAATNRNLDDEVAKGAFREDLYYRLKVVHIHMPDLKERREDIPILVEHFIRESNRTFERNVTGIDTIALQQLQNYDWPGNVRQLKNVIETMVVLAPSDVLTAADIPGEIRSASSRSRALAPMDVFDGLPLSGIEEQMIRHYLKKFNGNRAKVASALGISERTLYRKLKEYAITD